MLNAIIGKGHVRMSERTTADIVFLGDVRSSVESGSVIPDSNVVHAPLVPHLEVVVLGDMREKELEKVVGLFRMELENACGESRSTRKTALR